MERARLWPTGQGRTAIGAALAQDAATGAPAGLTPPDTALVRFIKVMPKVELDVPLEATLDPALQARVARRNAPPAPPADTNATLAPLDPTPQDPTPPAPPLPGIAAFVTEQDFCDLALGALARAAAQNVIHAELTVDVQAHLARGVALATLLPGLSRARDTAARLYGISSGLVLGLRREQEPGALMALLDAALPWRDHLVGIGLLGDDSGHAPIRFVGHAARARAAGLRVALACGPRHLAEALIDLKPDRIAMTGNIRLAPDLADIARQAGTCFAVRADPAAPDPDALPFLLDAGLCASIGGSGTSLTQALSRAQQHGALSQTQLLQIARNAISGAWLPEDRKAPLLARLAIFATAWR